MTLEEIAEIRQRYAGEETDKKRDLARWFHPLHDALPALLDAAEFGERLRIVAQGFERSCAPLADAIEVVDQDMGKP